MNRTPFITNFIIILNYLKIHFFKITKIPHRGNISFFGFKIFFSDIRSLDILVKEIFLKKVYKSSLPEAPLIIDGGANIGLSIFFFKRFYPKAKIIGFEPNPKSFELLKKNISVNNLRNVNLYNSALDINAKTISFFISSNMTDDDIGPSTNLRHVKDFHENKGSIQEITVPCTKLSQFINSDVDLLKLDIEGSESNVIQDLSKIFNKIKLLIIEYHYHSGQKTNPLSKIIDVIERHGYEYVIEGRRKMKFKKSRNFIIKSRPPL